MTAFVKPLLLSSFAAGSLAVAGSQRGTPPTPTAPPAPPVPGVPALPTADVIIQGVPDMPGGGLALRPGGVTSYRGFSPFGDDPRTRELVRKLVDAKDDDARDKMRSDLKQALGKAFDDRLRSQEKQVEDLEKQLRRLKEMVSKRREAKAEIVADRITALEKDAKGLGW